MKVEFDPAATRRAFLSATGIGLATGLVSTTRATGRQSAEPQYVLVQGDECEPIRPISGRLPVDRFYDYQLPEKYVSDENGASAGDATQFASAGTQELQRTQTSIAFLYRGPEGLSLVVVHGLVEASDGGSVTFRISGLPSDGRWVVKDDLYRNPDTGEPASTNYDRWRVEGTEHRIDWTWGSSGTDGGVFRGLGDEVEVAVDPAFNEAAALFDEHYEGRVTDWQFLSGSEEVSKRISLALDQPVRIATGSCEGVHEGRGQHEEKEEDEKEEDDKGENEDDKEENEDDKEEDEEENEKGKGHQKGCGKGHEKERGKGHEKHDDDDDDDEDCDE